MAEFAVTVLWFLMAMVSLWLLSDNDSGGKAPRQ